jgi:hypothetical protein
MMAMRILCFVLFCFAGQLLLAQSEGTVILFRKKEFLGRSYKIRIDGQTITSRFSQNSCLQIAVPVGTHTIEAAIFRGTKRTLQITAMAGQVCCVKAYDEMDFWDQWLVMQVVSASSFVPPGKGCDLYRIPHDNKQH